MASDIEQILAEKSAIIDKTIEKYLPRKYSQQTMKFTFGKARYHFNIETANKALAEPVWDLLDRGGKRWRPTLFLLTCEALGGNPKKFLDFVVLIELVHNGCLPADAKVLRNPGEYVSIAEIKEGDMVYTLSEKGNLERKRVIAVKFSGIQNVFKIKTRNREIRATRNHPFLVLTKSQPTRYKLTIEGTTEIRNRIKRSDIKKIAKKIGMSHRVLYNALNPKDLQLLTKEQLDLLFDSLSIKPEKSYFIERQTKFESTNVELRWKSLEELNKGGIIVVLRKINFAGESYKLPNPPKNPPKDKTRTPEYTSEKFCQLCGYILGDGVITIDRKSSRIHLCTSGEEDEVDAYSNIFQKVFGYKLKRYRGSHGTLTCCSYKVAWLLKELGFCKKATEKEIPQWIFTLPEKEKLAFVRGFLDSDGWVSKNGHACFASSSKKLIEDLKLLHDGVGFTSGNLIQRTVKNEWKNSIKKESVLWQIIVSNPKDILERIGTEKNSYKEKLNKYLSRYQKFTFSRYFPNPKIDLENFRFDRIKEIRPDGYEEVYDIMVEGSHNFIANNILVHNSLIIDDIEDSSELRRGKPCTYKLFGSDIAINTGNFMYYAPLLVFLKNNTLPKEKLLRAYEIYAQELINIHLGQAMDISWHRGGAVPSEEEYLQMCAFKTGTLARLAAKLGALCADADNKVIEIMGKLAESLGITFQIQDDVLNLTATSGRGQFSQQYLGEDIHEGKRTLMVIYTLQKANQSDRKRLLEILNMHTRDKALIEEAILLLKKYGAIEYSKRRAREIVEEAWSDADKILKPSKAKEQLHALVNFAIEREY